MSAQPDGIFAKWQPRYAEQGIATFPVRNKRPAVTNYLKIGLPASRRFVDKFPEEASFGLACGARSKITVVDVDAPDERLLADALSEYGPTPFIVRSGSGNYQAWYGHNGEGRKIRPDHRPIDILGHGYVVAPPSLGAKGRYTIIEGRLDDLPTLPAMRRPLLKSSSLVPANDLVGPVDAKIGKGKRNDTLWRECMRLARSCHRVEELMGAAMQLNKSLFSEPMPTDEVLKIVASAWGKELAGENWFGAGGRVIVDADEIDGLMHTDPDAFLLKTVLRRHHWGRKFVVANAMAETMPGGGWRRQRLAAARQRLIDAGEIIEVRAPGGKNRPGVYQFKGGQI